MDSFPIVVKVSDQFADFLLCRSVRRLHPLKAPNHAIDFAVKEPAHRAFNPFQTLGRFFAILQPGHLVDMLGAMIIIQNLAPFGKAGNHMLPQPVGPIAQQTDAHASLADVIPDADQIAERCRQVTEGAWRPVLVVAADGAHVPTRPKARRDEKRGRGRYQFH
jgi:hypothetical protein